jgi:hypothetical protein
MGYACFGIIGCYAFVMLFYAFGKCEALYFCLGFIES